jgi:DNA replicative helicase MCM subunit Mcm2 (Cdc46/Mcm family)
MELAKRPDFAELLYNSIAPSIYGHFEVKQALAFALFGGNEKNIV